MEGTAVAEPVAPPQIEGKPVRLTQEFVEDVLRETMGLKTGNVWVRKCAGDGECTHDTTLWFYTYEHDMKRCRGRGYPSLGKLLSSVHKMFGWLKVPANAGEREAAEPVKAGRRIAKAQYRQAWLLARQPGSETVTVAFEGNENTAYNEGKKRGMVTVSIRRWYPGTDGMEYMMTRTNPVTEGEATKAGASEGDNSGA